MNRSKDGLDACSAPQSGSVPRPWSRTASPLPLPGTSLLLVLLVLLSGRALTAGTRRSALYNGERGVGVEHAERPEFDPTVEITIEAWVYRLDASRCEAIVSRGFLDSYWLGFCPNLRFYRSGGLSATSSFTVPACQWTHVAVSYDRATARFYLDGIQVEARPLSHAGSGQAGPLWIGSDGGEFPFHGYLDELRIWGGVRTPGEIQADRRREVRSGAALSAVFPEGSVREALSGTFGQAAPGVADQSFGILPRDLVVPRAAVAPTFDGDVVTAGEYAGAEQLVLRYHDGARGVCDTAALLVHDGSRLYVGVQGLRDTVGAWPASASWVSLLIDPDSGRDALAQFDDVQVGDYLQNVAAEPFYLVGDGAGGWEPCLFEPDPPIPPIDCTPGPEIWEIRRSPCNGDVRPSCLEFQLDLSLFEREDVSDGIAVGHFQVAGIGDHDLGPDDAVGNSPATWASLTFTDATAVDFPEALLRGLVLGEPDSLPVGGHTVFLRDDATSTELARTTTNGAGEFLFYQRVPFDHDLRVEIAECAGCRYLDPVLRGPGHGPVEIFPREVTYPGCAVTAGCTYQHVTFRIDATPPVELEVLAVEVTQNVQNELFVPTGPGTITTASSRVPIVPGKDTLVRYYLAGRGGERPGYSDSLSVSIDTLSGGTIGRTIRPNTAVTTVDVPAEPAGATDRERLLYEMRADISRTVNFVIPGADLEDAELLTFNLASVPRIGGELQMRLWEPVELALKVVRLRGSGVGPEVSDAEIERTLIRYLERAYPVSRVRVIHSPSIRYHVARNARCRRVLRKVWHAFGGDARDVELSRSYPAWAPVVGVASDLDGCGGMAFSGRFRARARGGTCITMPFGDIVAQEIAHTMGLEHAGNDHGEAGGGGYRTWPYPHGSLGPDAFRYGNYGAVIEDGVGGDYAVSLVDPCPTSDLSERYPRCTVDPDSLPHDFMSYGSSSGAIGGLVTGSGSWISDVTALNIHQKIVTGGIGSGSGAGAGLAEEERVEAYLIDGEILADGTVEILPLLRKAMPESFLSPAEEGGEYRMELLDARGSVLHARPLEIEHITEHDEEVEAFREVVPYIEGVRRVVVYRGNEVAAEARATASPPFVEITSPEGGGILESGALQVTWTGGDPDGDPVIYLVQYSPDGGREWEGLGLVDEDEPLAVELTAEEVSPGQRGVIRITASDGFNTAVATTGPFFCVGPCNVAIPERASNLTAAAGVGEIVLDWDDNDPAGPFYSGYYVYRSTTPGSPGARLVMPPLPESRFVDRDVALGVTYCYRVRAVGATDTGPRSNEECAEALAAAVFRRGDTDGSGDVLISDPVRALNFLFLGGSDIPCRDAADSNDSGSLDIADPVHTLNWLFLGGGEPPAPGPRACGPDPTANAAVFPPCVYPMSSC